MNEAFSSDQEFIDGIKQGGYRREQVLKTFFNESDIRSKVIAFIRRNKGNDQDGEDLFAEGIIVLDRNIRENKFRGESSLSVYFISICKFLWMNRLRKMKRIQLTDENFLLDGTDETTPEMTLISDEQKQVIGALLHRLGEKCEQVLKMWMLNFSMQEIADKMSFSGEGIARKNKYRCFKKLKEIVKSTNTLNEV